MASALHLDPDLRPQEDPRATLAHLLMLRSSLAAMEQDAQCRLQLYERWGGVTGGGDRAKGLLEASLVWRLLVSECGASESISDTFTPMVKSLVTAIVQCGEICFHEEDGGDRDDQQMGEEAGGEQESGAGLGSGQNMPDSQDDFQVPKGQRKPFEAAGAAELIAAFSAWDLLNLSGALLRLMMRVFGAAEALGHFRDLSRGRAQNYRLRLDKIVAGDFMGRRASVKKTSAVRALLASLFGQPLDLCRLITLAIGGTFMLRSSDHVSYPTCCDLQQRMQGSGETEGPVLCSPIEVLRFIGSEDVRYSLEAHTHASLAAMLRELAAALGDAEVRDRYSQLPGMGGVKQALLAACDNLEKDKRAIAELGDLGRRDIAWARRLASKL